MFQRSQELVVKPDTCYRQADDTRITEVMARFERNVPIPQYELERAIGERLGTIDTRSDSSTCDISPE